MPVVSFATSKGGAGKTTAAIALATQLAKRNVKVTLMDCDPEQWTAAWGRAGASSQVLPEKLEVVSAPDDENDLLQAIDEAESRSSIVILDLEGSANAGVGYAIARSDLVIIPMRASGMDARAAIKTVRHVMTQRRLLNREILMAVLFTCTSSVLRYKLQAGLVSNLANAKIPVFKVELVDRVAFKEMLNRNCPLEALGSDVSGVQKAIDNAASLAGEVVTMLKGQSAPAAGAVPARELERSAA